MNTQYNCKCQIHVKKDGDYVPRMECYECTADAINNPKCWNYMPINLNDLGNEFRVVSKLEKALENMKWRVKE